MDIAGDADIPTPGVIYGLLSHRVLVDTALFDLVEVGQGTATPDDPVRRLRSSSSSRSDSFRREVLIVRTQSSISSCDRALAKNVRLEVTMPKLNGCFLTVTGATV